MSKILQLHDFLLDMGSLDEPVLSGEERIQVAQLEAEDAFENLENWFDFALGTEQVPQDDDWQRKPVSMRDFIHDEYYAGAQAGALYPKLEEDLVEIFEGGTTIHEVILAGAIGIGKTYLMGWGMFRQLYELSCMRNPQTFLGIAPGTPVVMVNLSVTGTQAKNACYNYVRTLIDGSPYFREHFQRDEKISSALIFPNNVIYQPGSSSEFSAIGANLIAGAVDEANFLVSAKKQAHERLQSQDVDHAMVLYRALSRRIESRFKFSRGWKGRLFLASSKVYEGDFIDQQVTKKQGRPGVKVMDYAHWEVRDFVEGQATKDPMTGVERYSGEIFQVAIGKSGESSRILTGDETVAEDTVVLRVPVEYRETFETDLDGAIRDVAGQSTLAVNPWIPNRKAIIAQAVEAFDGHPMVHPFKDDTRVGVVCQAGLADDLNLDVLCDRHVSYEGTGKNRQRVEILRPKRSPGQARFVHVDLAVNNDAAGIAMGYVAGSTMTKVKRDRLVDVEIQEVPIIVFELLASVVAPIGGEIEFRHIRDVLYRLRDVASYPIVSVSFDQFQSRDSRQILSAKGFDVCEVSVDRDVGPYTALRNGITEGWVYYYQQATVLRELRKVQRVVSASKKLKVDHPQYDMDNPRTGKGSKDITDAMAAVVHKILDEFEGAATAPAPSEGDISPEMPPGVDEWSDPNASWLVDQYIRQDTDRFQRRLDH